MVVYGEGRYACAEHGDQAPPPRSVTALEAGDFENHCARLRPSRSPGRWSTRTPGSTRAAATPPARSRQEHYLAAWVRQAPRSGGRAALPQRLRPADAPRHALLRGRRDVPLVDRAGRGRRTSSRTAARCATSCTSHDVARANVLALDQVVAARATRRSRRTTSPPGSRSRSAGWPSRGGRRRHRTRPGPGGQRPLPARRRPAHRRLAGEGPRPARLHRRRSVPSRVSQEFATAPLR